MGGGTGTHEPEKISKSKKKPTTRMIKLGDGGGQRSNYTKYRVQTIDFLGDEKKSNQKTASTLIKKGPRTGDPVYDRAQEKTCN